MAFWRYQYLNKDQKLKYILIEHTDRRKADAAFVARTGCAVAEEVIEVPESEIKTFRCRVKD
jgi:hypothetical protein